MTSRDPYDILLDEVLKDVNASLSTLKDMCGDHCNVFSSSTLIQQLNVQIDSVLTMVKSANDSNTKAKATSQLELTLISYLILKQIARKRS